jgi:uncharacterized OsmC-like protein
MHIKSTYQGELRTEATHIASGLKIITDAPIDNNGKGEAFSPTDLVAGALASCLMTIMGIEANKMGISLHGLSTDTQKLMSPPPRRIAKLRISVQWSNPTASAEQLELLKQKALTCPVALSLHPDITQEITFNF